MTENKREKIFGDLLTKKQILCYNKDVRKRKETSQTRKANAMKKITLNTILSLIANIDTPEAQEVRDEIQVELNKGAEAKAMNAELYDTAKGIVMNTLSETPVTIGELWDALADELPDGFTKGKLQYAMTRLWASEITKIEGKVNSYCKA